MTEENQKNQVDKELDDKIEQLVDKKVEEKLKQRKKEKNQTEETHSIDNQRQQNISRRNFLKMSALGIGTLGMSSLGASQWINLTQEVESGGIPTGVITMWNGSTSNIPSGWTLCDGNDPRSGSSSVPDLRNRFIVGAGDQYNVGNTGGEKQVQLTVDEMPSHTHTYQQRQTVSESEVYNSFARASGTAERNTGSTGGDQAHENRPPYYALAYIMKL